MEEEKNELVRMERCILAFFSIFNLMLFFVAEQFEWGNIVSLLYLLSIFFMWFICFNGYFDRKVRAFFYVTVMQLILILTVACWNQFESILLLVVCMTVLSALFGEKNLLGLPFFVTFLIFLQEIVKNRENYFSDDTQMTKFVLEFLTFFMFHHTVFIMVKKREKTQNHMEETIADLHQAEQSKTDFLCNVSHELRTPINSIVGISEIASKETDIEKIREEIDQIQMAGKSLLSVVSDVLDFSELQSGKVEAENEAYYTASTIQDIIKMSYSYKEENEIEILFNIDGNIPKGLYGDEKKIRRVILNLVNNAVKFTQTGYVLVKISSRKESYGVNLCFEIKDTGIGMKVEDQEKLFNSFTQVDGSRKRAVGGMGLGLSISQMLVRQMGGILSVKSKEGKGTLVQVVIPQKVLDEGPIAVVNHKEKMSFAVYIDMEQFQLELIRDVYSSVINECVGSLKVKYHFFKNFQELKRRLEKKEFTHLYMSMRSYMANQPYFDTISDSIQILVVKEPSNTRLLPNKKMIEISKPFNLLSLLDALNKGRDVMEVSDEELQTELAAPEAKVLVVDDNKMNLLVAKRIIEEYQIQVDTALSGIEALTMIEEQEYDIVFMDHMMPEMDGVETLHEIRNKVGSYFSTVPVIALTANAVAGSREMFLQEGFTDFIAKPIDIPTLERKCRKYLPQNKIETKSGTNFKEVLLEKEDVEQVEKQYVEILGDNVENTSESEKKNKTVAFADMHIEGLEVKEGLVYCRDEKIYKEMLTQHVASGLDTLHQLELLFQEEKWNEYTIAVHAAKSAMKTIGAIPLSDLCKELEMLGKEYGSKEKEASTELSSIIERIKEKHPKMVFVYRKLVEDLGSYFQIEPVLHVAKKVVFEKTPEYQTMIERLEDAAYDFDEEKMRLILDEIQDEKLKESIVPIYEKMERADYISAAEAFGQLFE